MKTYNIKEIIEKLTNLSKNGFQTLSEDDIRSILRLKTYKCIMCDYESDIKHLQEWRGMCYQCYAGETEFKNEGMI